MLIGKLASLSGFSRDTIRYYEKLGLLKLGNEDRGENNYKNYPPHALERLDHIDQLKSLSFTLTEIKDLLEALEAEAGPCKSLPERLDQKLHLLQQWTILQGQYAQESIPAVQGRNHLTQISSP